MLKKFCAAILAIIMLFSVSTSIFANTYFIDNFTDEEFSAKKVVLSGNYAFVAGGNHADMTDVLKIYDITSRKCINSLALPIYTTGLNYFIENMYPVGEYMYISWNKNKGSGDPPIVKYEISSLLKGELKAVSSVGVRGNHSSCLYDNKLFFTDPVFKTLSIINTDTNERKVVMSFDTLNDISDITGLCADKDYFYVIRKNEIRAYTTAAVYNGEMQDYESEYAIYNSEADINSVCLDKGNIYVADKKGLTVLGIADGKISEKGNYRNGGEVMAVEINKDEAYVYAHGTKSIDTINIQNANELIRSDSVKVNNEQTSGIKDFAILNKRIYAADLTDGLVFYSQNSLDLLEEQEEVKAESYTEELAISSNRKAIELVVGLGIMDLKENGLFYPNSYITRGEFARAVAQLLGGIQKDSFTCAGFDDVAEDHPYAKEIYALTNIGIINGVGDGKFLPDEPIKYEHAVIIMVKLLGYTPLMERGSSAISVATKIHILDNVSSMAGGAISRASAARLIYNSLETKRFDVSYYSHAKVVFNISDNETLLGQMGISIGKGQVTATEFTSLLGNKTAPRGAVIINGEAYPEGKSGASEFLGRYVTYYYKNDRSGECEILFVSPIQNDSVITVDSDNIADSTTEITFAYYKNGKLQKEDIRNATVIFNGKYYSDYDAEDLNVSEGEVILIDADRNGSVDTVFVRSFETYVVEAFADNIFRFKYNDKELNLKKNAYKCDKVVIDVDGTKFDADDKIQGVKEWSVVSVLKSRDEKIIEVYVTNMVVLGIVAGISESDGNSIFTIDNVEYPVSDSYFERANNPQIDFFEIELNDDVYAYVDRFGKIAAASENNGSTEYGYLIACGALKEFNSSEAEFKILARDQNEIHGSIQYFVSTEKFKINGKRVTDIDKVEEFYTATGFKEQVIKFTLNSEGKIKEIFTATNKVDKLIDGEDNPYYEENYVGFTENEFTYDAYISSSTAFRGGDMMTFEGIKYLPTLETSIFVVPNIDEPFDEDYKMYDNTNLFKSSTYPPGDIYVYDVDDDFNIGAIVVKVGGTVNIDEVGSSGKFAIVDSIQGGTTPQGEVKPILVSAKDENGLQEKIFIDDEDVKDTVGTCNPNYKDVKLTSLPRGSIIQYATNMRGEIAAIRILFIPTEEKTYFEYGEPRISSDYLALIFYSSFAKVIKVTEDGRILFNGHGSEDTDADGVIDWIWDGDFSNAKRNWDRNIGAAIQKPSIYLYDKEDKEVTTITLSDILPEDDIFIVKKSVYTNMIVVYR